MMWYKRLIKTALDLDLVRLKLSWIGQDKLILNNKEKYFCPVNRYNGSVIVITVHPNTKIILMQKNSHRNQSVSLYNDLVIIAMIYETYNDSVNRYNVSAQSIQRLFFLSRYNDSQTVITVHAENNLFSCLSILKWSPISLIDIYKIYLAKSLLQRAY
jgi:hypothetical protein